MKKPGYLIFTSMRRRAIAFLIRGENKTVSLSTSETVATPSTALCDYSDLSTMTIFDPRSNKYLSHSFNSRATREVQNAIVEPSQGLVYNQSRRLIVESTCWPTSQVALSFPWNPKSGRFQKIEQGIVLSSASYYHWLIEDLPTVLSSLREAPNAPLIMLQAPPAYCEDFARAVGRKTIFVQGPVFVKNLTLTEKCEDVGWPHPRDIEEIETFGSNFLQAARTNSRKIYISRKFSKRSPRNEADVERLFSDYGFEILFSEQMSLLAQAEVFQGANFIAGIHGAGLSNMIWSRSGAVVLDIANVGYWTECFHRLAHLKGHTYEHFLYDGLVTDLIDIDPLEQKLISLGLTRMTDAK